MVRSCDIAAGVSCNTACIHDDDGRIVIHKGIQIPCEVQVHILQGDGCLSCRGIHIGVVFTVCDIAKVVSGNTACIFLARIGAPCRTLADGSHS